MENSWEMDCCLSDSLCTDVPPPAGKIGGGDSCTQAISLKANCDKWRVKRAQGDPLIDNPVVNMMRPHPAALPH